MFIHQYRFFALILVFVKMQPPPPLQGSLAHPDANGNVLFLCISFLIWIKFFFFFGEHAQYAFIPCLFFYKLVQKVLCKSATLFFFFQNVPDSFFWNKSIPHQHLLSFFQCLLEEGPANTYFFSWFMHLSRTKFWEKKLKT